MEASIINQRGRSRSRAKTVITTYRYVNHSKAETSVSSIPIIEETSMSTTHSVMPTDIRVNHEPITFLWLDLTCQSTHLIVTTLRAVNDFIRLQTDIVSCFEEIKTSKNKIFLIIPSINEDLINKFHGFDHVEAIFIFDSKPCPIEHEYPKLMGFFNQYEELTRCLKFIMELYQQIQLELFIFDDENAFLWLQLWKDELMTRKLPVNNRNEFLEMARIYYRTNSRRLQLINDFDRTYRSKDAIRWCFRYPFPSNLIRHAFMTQDFDQLSLYRFLIVDVSRIIQQPLRMMPFLQLYRGMKLPKHVVDRFEKHLGQCVCASDFLTCTKSRAFALDSATYSGYRLDLVSVLFKIECDSTVKVIHTLVQNRPSMFLFDIGTTFRIVCFSRGTLIVIKMKAIAGEGKRLLQEYKETRKGISIPSLLKELTQSTSCISNKRNLGQYELEAEEFLKNGQTDLAIDALQHIQPVSIPVLLRIGHLYADKKGEYDSALTYYTQALKLQEKAGEDISDTVTRIGTIHYERRDYDSALTCHACALRLRESMKPSNLAAMATNLIGIANAHRANHELNEALTYAQRALTIREAIVPRNEIIIANTLATLANIYHELGDNNQALHMGQRALDIFRRNLPPHATELAGLMNNLGAIKLGQGAMIEARQYFEESFRIYQQTLPSTHPYIIKLENNIRYVNEIHSI